MRSEVFVACECVYNTETDSYERRLDAKTLRQRIDLIIRVRHRAFDWPLPS